MCGGDINLERTPEFPTEIMKFILDCINTKGKVTAMHDSKAHVLGNNRLLE